MRKNYIYLMHAIDTNKYKIGFTSFTDQRLRVVSRSVPFKVEFFKFYEVNNSYRYVEAKLHNYFKDKRVAREWFELNNDDLSHIDELVKIFDQETPDTGHRKIVWSWGKRKMTQIPAKEILQRYKEIENQYKIGKTTNKENIALRKKIGSIRTIIGQQLNISSGQLGRLRAIEKKLPHLIDSIDDGTMSVNEAYILTFHLENE